MTPQFTIQDGYLKEESRIKKPKRDDFYRHSPSSDSYYFDGEDYADACRAYETHIASLRSYRLANQSDWDNVPMPIGEDGFRIEVWCDEPFYYKGILTKVDPIRPRCSHCVEVAIPIKTTNEQDKIIQFLKKVITYKHTDKSISLEAQGYNEDECKQIGDLDYLACKAEDILKSFAIPTQPAKGQEEINEELFYKMVAKQAILTGWEHAIKMVVSNYNLTPKI